LIAFIYLCPSRAIARPAIAWMRIDDGYFLARDVSAFSTRVCAGAAH